ncbi:hypothetical protein B0H17DRAFT_1131796 [Mycena rosella]|uniref:Uncharacterized protein n=1 Tax=Mycena rosella TaxID=1033263 RepID=A0AAD7DNP9_MYCRO|nr:hypothetical protein B0H17DRAFT_1131796 [Mycena rosella]
MVVGATVGRVSLAAFLLHFLNMDSNSMAKCTSLCESPYFSTEATLLVNSLIDHSSTFLVGTFLRNSTCTPAYTYSALDTRVNTKRWTYQRAGRWRGKQGDNGVKEIFGGPLRALRGSKEVREFSLYCLGTGMPVISQPFAIRGLIYFMRSAWVIEGGGKSVVGGGEGSRTSAIGADGLGYLRGGGLGKGSAFIVLARARASTSEWTLDTGRQFEEGVSGHIPVFNFGLKGKTNCISSDAI